MQGYRGLFAGAREVSGRGACMRIVGARRLAHGQSSSETRVGFIGLGQMGSRMALNLVKKAGRPVMVHDVNSAATKLLRKEGAEVAESLEQLAKDSKLVITMLPGPAHVRKVVEGHIFSHAKRGTLIIDCSTIDPMTAKSLSDSAVQRGLRILDAPVSGGIGGAAAATLTFMVGGYEADVIAAKEILQFMGKNFVHCGGPGTGSVAKMCNNMVLAVTMAATAEAMLLGQKLGIDPVILNAVMNTSTGRSWVTDVYNPCPGVAPTAPASIGYKGGFATKLMHKDLGIAGTAAKASELSLPMLSTVHQLYTTMGNEGYSEKDFASIYDFIKRQNAGTQGAQSDEGCM